MTGGRPVGAASERSSRSGDRAERSQLTAVEETVSACWKWEPGRGSATDVVPVLSLVERALTPAGWLAVRSRILKRLKESHWGAGSTEFMAEIPVSVPAPGRARQMLYWALWMSRRPALFAETATVRGVHVEDVSLLGNGAELSDVMGTEPHDRSRRKGLLRAKMRDDHTILVRRITTEELENWGTRDWATRLANRISYAKAKEIEIENAKRRGSALTLPQGERVGVEAYALAFRYPSADDVLVQAQREAKVLGERFPRHINARVIAVLIELCSFDGGGNGQVSMRQIAHLLRHPGKLQARIERVTKRLSTDHDGLAWKRLTSRERLDWEGSRPGTTGWNRRRWIQWIFEQAHRRKLDPLTRGAAQRLDSSLAGKTDVIFFEDSEFVNNAGPLGVNRYPISGMFPANPYLRPTQ